MIAVHMPGLAFAFSPSTGLQELLSSGTREWAAGVHMHGLRFHACVSTEKKRQEGKLRILVK